MYKCKNNVGAHDCAQKGITLIALVITIVVMLILVAVTITMAVNGGLFDYAGKAVGDTEIARDEEQELANGKVEIDEVWYNSIDDYIERIKQVEPTEGIKARNVAVDDYGKKVTGYTCANSQGVNSWRIFYADNNNIYLIADDYIPYNYCPSSATQSIFRNSTDYQLSMENVIKDYIGSANITNSSIQELNKMYHAYLTSNNTVSINDNMKAVAYMLDKDVWSVFAGDKAEYAIGGPTIELLFASYNKTHIDVNYQAVVEDVIGYENCDDVNYYVWALHSSGMISTKDTGNLEGLYVITSTLKAEAMWVASPFVNTDPKLTTTVMFVGYNGVLMRS